MSRLWVACRATGGLGGMSGRLPAPGAVLDQPAWLMAAFDVLESEAAKIPKQ